MPSVVLLLRPSLLAAAESPASLPAFHTLEHAGTRGGYT